MWECFNCDFKNVDAAPTCAKCRAPKPEEGAKRMGRSFYASQLAAQEKVADEVRAGAIPPAPTAKKVRDKWAEAQGDAAAMTEQLAAVERRQYALRESIRQLVNVVRNPQARNNEQALGNVIQTLVDWELEN
ncbi:MAG: hypothetical protein M3R04_00100 [bacterium]|nr:hypothetical protein [bacterium]